MNNSQYTQLLPTLVGVFALLVLLVAYGLSHMISFSLLLAVIKSVIMYVHHRISQRFSKLSAPCQLNERLKFCTLKCPFRMATPPKQELF